MDYREDEFEDAVAPELVGLNSDIMASLRTFDTINDGSDDAFMTERVARRSCYR